MGVVSLLLCPRRQCPQTMGVESAVTPANVVLKIASTQQAQDYFAEPVPLFPKLIEGRTLEVRAVLYVWISN